jgi:hypothetical protein
VGHRAWCRVGEVPLPLRRISPGEDHSLRLVNGESVRRARDSIDHIAELHHRTLGGIEIIGHRLSPVITRGQRAGPLEGSRMADMRWEHAAEARAALNAIVTDPEHGVAVLSSPRTMSNLLKDLLPDAPREKNLLIAAADAGLADTLNEHVAQGMDPSTAIRLTASSFSARTPLTPDACSWVTAEIAAAMGIAQSSDPVPTATSRVPPATTGTTAASAVSSPGQEAASGYAPAQGSQPPRGQVGYQQPIPGYPAAGYAPGSSGYLPPNAFSPAQNAQAYGPGIAAGMPATPGYQPLPRPGVGRRTNSLAITSLVLGVVQFFGWFIFLLPGLLAAILAIVLGFVATKQVSSSGESGRGLAITGVVLGFVGILVVGLLFIVGYSSLNNQP